MHASPAGQQKLHYLSRCRAHAARLPSTRRWPPAVFEAPHAEPPQESTRLERWLAVLVPDTQIELIIGHKVGTVNLGCPRRVIAGTGSRAPLAGIRSEARACAAPCPLYCESAGRTRTPVVAGW